MSCNCIHDLAPNAAQNVYGIPPMTNQTLASQNDNTILVPSAAAYLQIPQQNCLSCQNVGSNFNVQLSNQMSKDVYLNIDGQSLKRNLCLQACNNSILPMYNPMSYQPSTNWMLPGGVVSAVKYFAHC